MIKIIQFSPTGNTGYLANELGKALEVEDILALEHTSYEVLEGANHLVILYAIHAFNAPRTVKRFVKEMPKGLAKNVSLIGVGCNTTVINDASSLVLKKHLEKKGYQVIVDRVMAMPLTLVMSFPEDLIRQQLFDAKESIIEISKAIKTSQKDDRKIDVRGRIFKFIGSVEPFAARFFGLELHAKKSCTQCGLCVRECPEKNIRMSESGKIKFGFKCLLCLRCIYNCPEKAITPRISKFIPIKKGYNINKYL